MNDLLDFFLIAVAFLLAVALLIGFPLYVATVFSDKSYIGPTQ